MCQHDPWRLRSSKYLVFHVARTSATRAARYVQSWFVEQVLPDFCPCPNQIAVTPSRIALSSDAIHGPAATAYVAEMAALPPLAG